MSFLDRFKRKADEKSPGSAPEGKSDPAQDAKPDSAPASPARKVDPALQIAAATIAAGYNPDFKIPPKKEKEGATPAAPAETGPQHEVILELGDFLSRLPAQMLKEGTHDPKTPLKFDIAVLADRIARGQTTITVGEIYSQAPTIFRSDVIPSDTTEIRFPWQKVMKMLTAYKSATGGPAPAGLTSAAAETLAEKLRNRRGVRNIIPGAPADVTPPAVPATAATGAPAAVSVPAPIAPLGKPPELVLPVANADEDQNMTKEDALKARDQVRGLLARIKGEFERHLAAGEHQRKTLLDEREKMVVDLVRAKREIEDKSEQAEFEKSVATKSTDNLTKTQQERDAFKIELSNLKVELSKLNQQNEQRIKDLITERDALAQQQANLSKQITEFQKRGKISTMLGADVATAGATAAAGTAAAASQRQIDELQRRINVLETSQRDAAQELGKEREAKIKLERQLATADRLQQESLAKVQELQAGAQRDHEGVLAKHEGVLAKHEGVLAKREADAARALKEVQDQLVAHQAAHHSLRAESQDLRQQLAAAQEAAAAAAAPAEWEARASAQLESDIESYRGRIKTLLQERDALGGEKNKLSEELIARTKELSERTAEKETLAKAEAEARAKAEGAAQPSGDAIQLVSENDKLKEQVKALEVERDGLAAKAASLAEATAGAAAAAETLQKLTAEKDQALAELEKARAEIAHATTGSSDATSALQKLTTEKEAVVSELAKVKSEHSQATAGSAEAAATLQKLTSEKEAALAELTKAKAEITKSAASSAETAAALQKATAEKEAALADLAKAKAELNQAHAGSADAAATAQKLAAQKDAALADLAKAKTEIAQISAGSTEVASALQKHTAEKESALSDLGKAKGEIALAATAAAAAAAAFEKLKSEKDVTHSELTKSKTDLEAAVAQHQQALSQAQNLHKAELDQLNQELEAARTGGDEAITAIREGSKRVIAERDSVTAELNRVKEAHQATKERMEAELTAALKARESEANTLSELRQATEKFFAEKKALNDELVAIKSSYDTAAGATKASHEKALAEIHAQRNKLAEEKDALTTQVASLRSTHEADSAAAKSAHEKALAELQATHSKVADEKKKLADEVVALTAAHAATSGASTEAYEKAVAELTADRDRLREQFSTLASEVDSLRKQREELVSGRESLTAENFAARSALEKSLAEVTEHRDDLVNRLEIMASELTGAKQEHGLAFAALDRDRDSLRAAKDAIAAEFATTRASLEKTITELHTSHDTIAAHKSEVEQQLAAATRRGDDLQGRLEKTAASLAETQAGLKKSEEAIARQAKDNADAIAKLGEKHDRVLAALAAEKDAVIAKLNSDKATLIAEVDDKIASLKSTHEKAVHNLRDEKSDAVSRLTGEMNATVAALTLERDKIRDALIAAEQKYTTEIAMQIEARESAQLDSATVAERLAAVLIEGEQKQTQLTQERDAILADKQRLTAELEQARETHKAQAGVFASEFKAVVKQRDDFISQLDTERKNLADKTAAFERDRAALNAAEAEMKARTEREIARMRRERDSIAQQRDALRGRIAKVMDDQRQMLDEASSQATYTSMKHNEPVAPPPAAAAAPKPAPAAEKPPEVVEAEPMTEPAPPSKSRESKGRESRKKEANVIDITEATEAEIVAPLGGEEGRLKMPRVRPVVIPPPQVRSL